MAALTSRQMGYRMRYWAAFGADGADAIARAVELGLKRLTVDFGDHTVQRAVELAVDFERCDHRHVRALCELLARAPVVTPTQWTRVH